MHCLKNQGSFNGRATPLVHIGFVSPWFDQSSGFIYLFTDK